MKKTLLFLLLFSPCCLKAQNAHLLDTIISQSFRIRVELKDSLGRYRENWGMGLLLNNKYLATCYHVIYGADSHYKVQKIQLYYSKGDGNENPIYDSIELTPNFQITKNQYDFSKHVYNKDDWTTDIIVLKLQKPLNKGHFKILNHKPDRGDKTYCVGNYIDTIDNMPQMFLREERSYYFTVYTQPEPYSQEVFVACIGNIKEGFSGGPLYNVYGEVIGLITSGWKEIPSRKLGLIKDVDYDKVVDEYKNGKRIFSALNIFFVMGKYLKGYVE